MKKLAVKFLYLLFALYLTNCSVILRPADNKNPCTLKYKFECDEWRIKFPKEYARYLERVKKSDIHASAAK